MAKLRSSNIEPSTGTTLALGASGDAALISSDSIKANTFQDLGGNSLWVSDGSGTLSSVNSSLAGGGYTLILSQTATEGTTSTVSFTSDIDSTYDEYVWVFTDLTSSNAREFMFNGSIDGGSNYNVIKTTTFFSAHHQDDDGDAGLNYRGAQDIAQGTGFQSFSTSIGGESDECSAGILHLFSPGSTTYVKHFCSRFNTYGPSDESWDTFIAGYFNDVNDINAIQFKCEDGTFGGTIQMYGVS